MQAFYSLHFCATDSRARIWTVKAQAVQHIWIDTGFACIFIYSGTLHLSDKIDTMETVNDTNVETAARVEQIKQNEEMGIRFMNAFEEKMQERREGRAEGRAEGQEEIARKMLSMGMDICTIAEATGLSEEAVRNLQKE